MHPEAAAESAVEPTVGQAAEHLGRPDSLFINGSWRAADGLGIREVIDPCEGTVVAVVAESSVADVAAAVAAAKAAFRGGKWSGMPTGQRVAVLEAVADALQRSEEHTSELQSL